MFFIYSLAALALLSALIFAVPLRAKAWTALALVGVGALAGAACAIGVLADGTTLRLWTPPGTLFGGGVLVEYFERKCVDVDIAVAMLEEAACRAQFLDNEKPHLAQQFQIAAR